MTIVNESLLMATDPQGYLKNPQAWNQSFAEACSAEEGISLTSAHWELLYFLREFYQKYHTSPSMRLLVKAWQQNHGKTKGSSHYLYSLFPKGPAIQGSKIAGLPKPVNCL